MESRVCLICSVPITVPCLGVEACRACAAFFKRTTIANRKFTCRQSDGKCTIINNDKFNCRSCRYDRCVRWGMSYPLPQEKRPRKKETVVVDDAIPSTSSSSIESTTANYSLLGRMKIEYKASVERRVRLEREYVARHNLPLANHPIEEFFVGNFTSFFDLFKIAISESTSLLQNVFDDFDSLPIVHRVTMFKHFVSKFAMLEGIYLTSIYYKNTTTYMSSLITCLEMNNWDHWLPEDHEIARTDDFHTILRSFLDEYTEVLAPMMKMNDLTEREFHAMGVLCYCDLDASLSLPDNILQNTEKTRAKLFVELQDYYRNELNMHDFSKRLANLMTMSHGAGEAGKLMCEEMRMYSTMFNLYSDDQLIREFFLD